MNTLPKLLVITLDDGTQQEYQPTDQTDHIKWVSLQEFYGNLCAELKMVRNTPSFFNDLEALQKRIISLLARHGGAP